MSTQQVFTSISSEKIASLINVASEQIVLVLPAFRCAVSNALLNAIERLGTEGITIVIDCDEEVFRLGYGDYIEVEKVRNSGVNIRQCSGLRIGVLVVDEKAWVFSPTALYVQDEVHSNETPNAIQLVGDDIDRLLKSLVPNQTFDCNYPDEQTEIGTQAVSESTLKVTKKALEIAPPIAFNIARQVRVFQPYIQYVEMSLKGCSIQKKRIQIPKSIQGLEKDTEIEKRLRTTFELIEKDSKLSSREIENELKKIRDNFTPSLGEPWGRVILKSVRKVFDERIDEFKEKVEQYRNKVKANLEQYLKKSKEQIIEHYYPLVKKYPPDAIIGKTLFSAHDQEKILKNWLDKELEKSFPKLDELVTDIKLDVQFRDVTYETLNEDGFSQALRNAYPEINWDRPFNEFNAAKEKKA